MKLPITGGCACGKIRYACAVAPLGMGNCHCRACQYASGNGHSSVVAVPAAALTVSGPAPKRYASRGESGREVYRSFCADCGTPLFCGNRPEFVAIRVGSLDDPSEFRPQVDSRMESAQPWDRVDPATLKFDKDMPGI